MTNTEENTLSMFLTYRDFIADYTALTSPLPKYSENLSIFLGCISSIQEYSEMQKAEKTGVTGEKNNQREALIVTTMDNYRKLNAYAVLTKNIVLTNEIKITATQLKDVADTALHDYANLIYNKAQVNIADLESYEISTISQTAFKSQIDKFNDALGKPGVSRVAGTETTKYLKAEFKKAKQALADMNIAVNIIQNSQPDFYRANKAAQKIIKLGHRSMAIKGQVNDSDTKEPVKGVVVNFYLVDPEAKEAVLNGSVKPVLIKKTAKKGGFTDKTLKDGIYTVIFKKTGYKIQTETVTVSEGRMALISVMLVKS